MLSLERIVERLQDRRLDRIKASTGLSNFTIIAIKNGKNKNPNYATLTALSDYFEDQEKQHNNENNK